MSAEQRPRIVFLNRSYWPDIEATGQLLTDLCRGLTEHFDVHVVCGQPNSPEPDSTYLHVGAECRDGVTIHRLDHRRFQKRNPFGRIFNLLSFYFAANRYLKTLDLRPEIVVSETDPFLLPIAGARYAKRSNAEHCIYLQDIYPDVAEAVGKVPLPFVAPLIRRKLRAAYRGASRIIVLGRCMRKRLISAPWSIPREKIEIIPNWSDCQAITPIDHVDNEFRQDHCKEDTFVVMHSGNMGLTQRLDVLISATLEPNWPSRAKLMIVGNGASRGQLMAHAENLNLPEDRVEFVYYQPRNKLAESLSAADVHVVSMHEKVTGCLCPSKLYGIMAAGRSVIAIADPKSDLCLTVAELRIGWCVAPGSAAAIAGVVAEAEAESRSTGSDRRDGEFRSRQTTARQAAIRDFDRPVIVKRFARLLGGLIESPRGKVKSPGAKVVTLDVEHDPSDSDVALSL